MTSHHGCCITIVYSVDATEGGKNAILALAGGDLRRVLNLLQSTAMAYPQVCRKGRVVLLGMRDGSFAVGGVYPVCDVSAACELRGYAS